MPEGDDRMHVGDLENSAWGRTHRVAHVGNFPSSLIKLVKLSTSGGKLPFVWGKLPFSTPAAVDMMARESKSEQKLPIAEFNVLADVPVVELTTFCRPGIP